MVNIHDVEINKNDWAGDKLEAIFKRQGELMQKYHDIEAANGLLQTPDCPVDLHDRFGQARLKDFAWRATEELGEALDAMDKFLRGDHGIEHCNEELADALHFLTEFTILAGLGPKDIIGVGDGEADGLDLLFHRVMLEPSSEMARLIGVFVKHMGMTCNCFKNKPWKQSHMLTDTQEFYMNLLQAWVAFIKICKAVKLNAESLTEYYFGKSEVNRFRQRSNY